MKTPSFGSRDWIEKVYAGEAVRKVAGRSRPTQRYVIAGEDRKPIYAEGGNESTARSLMILGVNRGHIKRWLFQPFALSKAIHGVDAVPDVIFEDQSEWNFVVEARSARFQTAAKLEKAVSIERVINATGRMTYLYWTDAWPLNPTTSKLVRELRRCGTSNVPRGEIEKIESVLKTEGPQTFAQLRSKGSYRDVVMAAVWHGRVDIDLLSAVTDQSVVSLDVKTRRFHELLTARVGGQTWWTSLGKS